MRYSTAVSVTSEGFYTALGKRIRAVREQRSLTQTQLGARLAPPVTRASIANVEAGKQRVLAHTLVQIARVLGTPLDQLAPVAEAPAADIAAAIERELKFKLAVAPSVMARLTRAVWRASQRS